MRLGRADVVAFLFVLTAACVVAAEEEEPVKRRYWATRVSTPPVIDGRFDDACWAETQWSRDFVQREPHEGTAPSEPTAFQVIYDERNLYVAIRAYDSEPAAIESRVTRRDDRQGDQVELFLDSYFDHQTAFVFNVNSAGVRTDYVVSEDGVNEDYRWDAVWHA